MPEKRGSSGCFCEKRVGPPPGSPARGCCARGWRPHATSGACATFFVNREACSTRFSAQTARIASGGVLNKPGYEWQYRAGGCGLAPRLHYAIGLRFARDRARQSSELDGHIVPRERVARVAVGMTHQSLQTAAARADLDACG